MANVFNQDFIEFIITLNKNKVEYILVGGYAVIYHGYNRTTGDMDIWVHATSDNYNRLLAAFNDFGMSVFDMSETKFLDTENFDVFSFGRPPVCIELLTKVKGLTFIEAYSSSSFVEFGGTHVQMIDIRDLILAKKAAGRNKDLDDLEHL
jgi:predicted nucleotidyltransferase